jgi:hypothetical protein
VTRIREERCAHGHVTASTQLELLFDLTFVVARCGRAGTRSWADSSEPVRIIPLPALAVAHPTIQPMPDGRILIVGARAQWHSNGPDQNAVIYGPEGNLLAQATLGEDIEHVQATREGHV